MNTEYASAPAADPSMENAGREACETLLNCYCREVALPSGETRFEHEAGPAEFPSALTGRPALLILLPLTGSRLAVATDRFSPTGNFRHRSEVYARHDESAWSRSGWSEAARAVIAELSVRHDTPFNNELLAQIADSVRVTATFLERRTDAPPARDAVDAYIDSEQSLLFGHPFHPAPKSRGGFTGDDTLRYSPELRAGFPLRYFAVSRDCIHEGTTTGESTSRILERLAPSEVRAGEGFVIVPAHPWQARWLLDKPSVRRAIADGRIRDLGEAGPAFHPTSSVRTLFSKGHPYFYKFSLNVRLTNCIRTNAVYELRGALAVNHIMRRLLPELRDLFPGTEILEEPAFLTVDPGLPYGEPDGDVAEGFAFILRAAFPPEVTETCTPVMVGSLFGDKEFGEARIATMLRRIAHRESRDEASVAREWLSRYVRLVMYPTFYCHFRHGVVIESHLQNVIIGLTDDMPERVFLRDFEGVKLDPLRHPAESLPDLDERERNALWYDDEKGWKRVAYCVFTNNFCEVVHRMAPHDAALRASLWEVVRDELLSFRREHCDDHSRPRIDAILSGEPFPAKGNLVNRFFKRADKFAEYIPVPNPMGPARS